MRASALSPSPLLPPAWAIAAARCTSRLAACRSAISSRRLPFRWRGLSSLASPSSTRLARLLRFRNEAATSAASAAPLAVAQSDVLAAADASAPHAAAPVEVVAAPVAVEAATATEGV